MSQRVLAITADGRMSYCVCPPEMRGKGRCNHIYHQFDGETNEEFLQRVQPFMMPPSEGRTTEEIAKELISNNLLSFNKDPDWSKVITPDLLSRYLRLGDTVFEGEVIQEIETDENGDEVDHLYIVGKFGDFVFKRGATGNELEACDFGCVPHIREDGTFTIKGVEYRCLPVVSRDKVGYGQGYSRDGKPTIWLYQENGNLGISIPVDGETCKIFGKDYKKEDIQNIINSNMSKNEVFEVLSGHTFEELESAKALINEYNSKDNLTLEEKKALKKAQGIIAYEKEAEKLKLLISTLDTKYIKERCPEFGNGEWMNSLSSNFKADVVNDLSYRKVFTYEDQVKKELESQLYRMGGTLRNSMIEKVDDKFVPKKDAVPILFQKNNTENVRKNLLGRSNVQMAENLNPLSAYSQSHKVSLVGIEGYNKDQCPDRLRMVGDSLRGISDPLDQSSGKGVGLSIFLKGSDVQGGVIRKNPNNDCYSLSDFVPYCRHNNPNRVSMATSQMRQAMVLSEGEDPRRLGDPVSDRAWSQISGAKMGRNLRVAYLTGEKEWEDSAEISESAAKKLAAKKKFTFGKDSRFKDGMKVSAGMKVGGKTVKYDGVLKETPSGFSMEVEVPFTPGNKISGRYGNKCTVGRIRPDSEMPQIWDPETKSYKPAEIIMSPLSIGKRGNIGAILETQNGTLDSSAIVPVKLPDGRTVRANNGVQFIMRLNQISQEKNHANSGELTEGREAKARFGEMESILLSTTERRRKVLKYLKNQGTDEVARLDSLLKAIGVYKK